ncbi:unnamed protein product [Eruca vesicaria subsp. sativa]|uniref:Uncharacterized protein n=1 Tax=Eruca vesicaria subsp. sativa TaxID=29727 RepID=A0ABC8KMG5_ERUVS|nr:unnamed protein product [Eruca vesicaria subsp. sativa]
MTKTSLFLVAILLSLMVITSLAQPDPTLGAQGIEMKDKCETNECIIDAPWTAHLDYAPHHDRPPGHWAIPPPKLVDDIDTHVVKPNY